MKRSVIAVGGLTAAALLAAGTTIGGFGSAAGVISLSNRVIRNFLLFSCGVLLRTTEARASSVSAEFAIFCGSYGNEGASSFNLKLLYIYSMGDCKATVEKYILK